MGELRFWSCYLWTDLCTEKHSSITQKVTHKTIFSEKMMEVASGSYYWKMLHKSWACCCFLGTWETEIKHWGGAYRPDDLYHCSTHNGAVRLNEDLKHVELEGATGSSLSELLTIIIENFIPTLYMKYVELKVRCTSRLKGCQGGIPSYVDHRPKLLVKDLRLLKNSVTTFMIDSVKPEDGKDVCNSVENRK